jgi:hypothetical protein
MELVQGVSMFNKVVSKLAGRLRSWGTECASIVKAALWRQDHTIVIEDHGRMLTQ